MQYSQKNMELGRADQEKMTQQQDLQQPLPPRVKQVGSQMEANHQHQPPPPQKCPRCDSSNTKFCYYNNYSLSQPRYFCKACRRYWTQGGTLRNVPVGGGCRKSKRPRPVASSSSGSEIARSQSLSTAIPSQNLTGVISGHESLRAFTPAMPSMSNSYLSSGGLLSSLSAMQSLPAGLVNQGAAMHLGGGNSPYGANMALLQGLNFSSLKPEAPRQFQPPNEFFPLHQSLNFPPRPLSSWYHQSFINRDLASSSGVIPSFWRSATATATADGYNQAGSSFDQNRWPDKHPGFDPSQ